MKKNEQELVSMTYETQEKTLQSLRRTKRQLNETICVANQTAEELDIQHRQLDDVNKEVDSIYTNLDKTIELQRQISLYSCLCSCFFPSRPNLDNNNAHTINNHTKHEILREQIIESQENRDNTHQKNKKTKIPIHSSGYQYSEEPGMDQITKLDTKQALDNIAAGNKRIDDAISDIDLDLDQLKINATHIKHQVTFFNEKLDTTQSKIDVVFDKTVRVAEKSQYQKTHA